MVIVNIYVGLLSNLINAFKDYYDTSYLMNLPVVINF